MRHDLRLVSSAGLALLLAASAHAQAPPPPEDEDRFAVAMLADVAHRGDAAGLELARERIARGIRTGDDRREARGRFLVAFAEWQLAQALAADRERAAEAARRAIAAAENATRLDPGLAAAAALANQAVFALYSSGGIEAKEGFAEMARTSQQARAIDPRDPVVMLVEALTLTYAPKSAGGDPPTGLVRFDEAVRLLEGPQDGERALLWLPTALMWQGAAQLQAGDVEAAAATLDRAMTLRPDFARVRDFLLPMTVVADPGTLPASSAIPWATLAADALGDGRPGLSDLRALDWHLDPATDRLLFRFRLAAAPDPKSVGVNLPFDLDGDPANGRPWWGGNTAFRFDRLVTVWLLAGKDGRYRGLAGIGDAEGTAGGRYTDLSRDVAFRIDGEAREIVVGFPRPDLGARGRVRLLGVVGTGTTWSDVAVDEGACEIVLPE